MAPTNLSEANASESLGEDILHGNGASGERGWDDATWILTSAFIIFTMQSGFGLLESGSASRKNEVNIMVKNAVDVIFGGMSYWMFGYGFSFGQDRGSNAFIGIGHAFVQPADDDNFGNVYSSFFFHTSFATTSTTIVSGAMAERTKLEAYIIFSFFNTFVYCFPSRWVWANTGWLKSLGVIDIAGASCVHLVGGVTGLVATVILKPRTGRFDESGAVHQMTMGMPTNAIFGMFMLWWGWLGFNCGSTYGITGGKWKLAARSAVMTITSSIGGGIAGLLLSYVFKKRTFDITYLISGILGSLVAGTALCALAHPWEGLVIGLIGGSIACLGGEAMAKIKIDDPVGVVSVHGIAAVWGLISVGLFVRIDRLENISSRNGLFYGGGFYMLGVQTLTVVTIIVWTTVISAALLKILDTIIGLRVSIQEEMLGSDIVEHALNGTYDKVTGELRGLDGELLEIVRQNGDNAYNQNLRRISEAVARGIPKEMLSSVVNLGNSSLDAAMESRGEPSFAAGRTTGERLSVITISSTRRISPVDDISSLSLVEMAGKVPDVRAGNEFRRKFKDSLIINNYVNTDGCHEDVDVCIESILDDSRDSK
ncbi:putative ammonium transporter 2 [Ptychodera flava]|uniref:putative ammonium transporter 2 n=1 Tax=Ptychodera flava TaxID=63121 RepID=UPI00396A6975